MKTRFMLVLFLFVVAAAPATQPHAGESMAATVRLNVRGGPGIDHPVLDTLAVGERVLMNACKGDWCRITHVGIDGWVFAPFLVSAGFSETWSARSRDLPADLDANAFGQPQIGVTVEMDAPRRCPRHRPFC